MTQIKLTPKHCILALDLGTTAFKAAPADEHTVFGRPTVVRYRVDYTESGVTCPPERYYRTALRALRGAAQNARDQGLTIHAIGISSQAQTFLALDAAGDPIQPAIVWTDANATSEAEEATRALPDFAQTAGFLQPIPLQFLPKVLRFRRQDVAGASHPETGVRVQMDAWPKALQPGTFCTWPEAQRFLLLNEWLIYRLTGEAFGDETNQGMGGFYDIVRRSWSEPALALADIRPDNLAQIAPAATLCARLKPEIAHALNLPNLPVYSCGNDQSCAAIGAGLQNPGDILCNFGTALVIYTLKNHPVPPTSHHQIAGISPLAPRTSSPSLPFSPSPLLSSPSYFLLGLESECGNILDWLAKLLYPRRGVATMIEAALKKEIPIASLPQIILTGSGSLDLHNVSMECRAEHLARALLEYYADRFVELLKGVSEPAGPPKRLLAGGGLSQNDAWLDFLSRRCEITFQRTPCEHPGLVGIARILARRENLWNTASNT